MQTQRILVEVLNYMHAHLDELMCLGEAAAHVHMSVPTFCRFFRRATGRSFVDYANDWRVSRACALLGESSMSILEISHRAGFNNLAHFNRQFRQRRGMTPREYRTRA